MLEANFTRTASGVNLKVLLHAELNPLLAFNSNPRESRWFFRHTTRKPVDDEPPRQPPFGRWSPSAAPSDRLASFIQQLPTDTEALKDVLKRFNDFQEITFHSSRDQ